MTLRGAANELPLAKPPVIDDSAGFRVVVSVGTDHHPFDRLMGWIERWCSRQSDVAVLVQRGTSIEPAGVVSRDLIAHDEIRRLFASADAVVSHGGPSTVMDARTSGRLPIVVARNPDLGEHIDGHQQRFADYLDETGMARLARTEEEFGHLLDDALADPSAFAIDASDVRVPPGVVRFGAVVDQLLGITTPIDAGADAEALQ